MSGEGLAEATTQSTNLYILLNCAVDFYTIQSTSIFEAMVKQKKEAKYCVNIRGVLACKTREF